MDTVDYEAGMLSEGQPAAVELVEGWELIDYPTDAGKVVSMIAFNGQVLIACEYGVFEMVDGKAVRLKFVRGF